MSYQVPAKIDIIRLLALHKIGLYSFKVTNDLKFNSVIISLYVKGLVGVSGCLMRVNVYRDAAHTSLLIRSKPIDLGNDIVRVSEKYSEVRFDFPKAGNNFAIDHTYYVEFELYGSYPIGNDDYLGLVIDWDSPLAILYPELNIVRFSSFYDVVKD